MHPFLIVLTVFLVMLLLTAVLYVLCLRPNKRRRATEPFLSYNYTHRGLFGGKIPENSLAAFEASCRAGYGIELDVALSRDGVPTVFHDATLARMCGVPGKISDYTSEELSKMPLDGRPAHTIPTFREVLDLVDGRVPLIVEFKVDAGEKPDAVCEAAMKLLDTYTGAYCVESFNPMAVRWFRRNRPLLVRGQLSDVFHKTMKKKFGLGQFIVETLCLNFLCRPDFIAFNFRYPHHLPLALTRALFHPATVAWTPRSDGEVTDALAHFDAVIFENANPPQRNETK